ncbi:hypothetical protein [Acinetobacter silvestris]|uniref:Uncharacterized protein n=1 Tax=Acinetobacter silvestris TaxID=1977882 RepID=A0A1Y3C8A8_9GAMM|nr:hypothetical protein [Acinetobacter silvestris]OTG62231.1 hypothetical protein B9T28_14565 [Acinetobacter silvestris]
MIDDKKIIKYLKDQKPRSTGHKVLSKDEFIDGVIAKLSFDDGSVTEAKFWVILTKNHNSYAENESQLIQVVNTAISKNQDKVPFWDRVFNISGWIALAIVITVIFIALSSPTHDVPEFFKAAMLTILGFYFGGVINNKKIKVAES